MILDRRAFLMAAGAGAAAMQQRRAVAQERKTYKACVLGDTTAGGYGHSLHRIWAARDDVAVVGLADPHPQARAVHARECAAENTYADYQEMLAKEKPDLLAIGPRWSVRHKEYLLAAADAGCHGLIEKPLAPDLAEADTMCAAVDTKKLKWSIAFNFRVAPSYRHAKRMILEEKIIGDLLEIRGRGKEDQRAGGEDLIVLGTHNFDMMIDLLGRPQWCFADIQHEGRPAEKGDVRKATEPIGPVLGDTIDATFGFPGGVYGRFASAKNPEGNGGRWGFDVCGTKGLVSVRMNNIEKIHLFANSPWSPITNPAQWEPLPGLPDAPAGDPEVTRYAPIVNDLITAIEQDRPPEVSLDDGRNALEMVQAVNAAHVVGGRVALPLEGRTHPLTRW